MIVRGDSEEGVGVVSYLIEEVIVKQPYCVSFMRNHDKKPYSFKRRKLWKCIYIYVCILCLIVSSICILCLMVSSMIVWDGG